MNITLLQDYQDLLNQEKLMDKTKLLTIEQAYRAMFYFLENEYKITDSFELGGMLGSLSWEVWKEGGPGDPGTWEDWINAVQKALAKDESAAPPNWTT